MATYGAFGNSDLRVSRMGLGCYGMSGAYGAADDAESIATIRMALDLGINLLDTSAGYGRGHNHRLIGEAIRGRRDEVVIHSKSGSPRDRNPNGGPGGGDAAYLRKTCEESLANLGVETLDVFCMSRVDPDVPVEASVAAMSELVKEGKTRYISLSECSAQSLRRGNAVHPLVSLQMEYSLFSREAEVQGQIAACRELNMAMMAYGVLGQGMITSDAAKLGQMEADDIRHRMPRFQGANVESNLRLRSVLEGLAGRKGITLAQLAVAWPIARGKREGTTIIPIAGMKSRKHLRDNAAAMDVELTPEDLDEIDRVAPPGAVAGTRYSEEQMKRLNV